MLKTNIQQGYLDKEIGTKIKKLFESWGYCLMNASCERDYGKHFTFHTKVLFLPTSLHGTIDIVNGKIEIVVSNKVFFEKIKLLIEKSGKDKKYDFNLRLT